ncbi:aspartate kinase [Aureivirga sp. CE67]|uniref:aspartate kinase n=1 Tax=Aureivirga sp. CE67 TaxID=1788983 RepID=UPI0018C97B4F|nr:aspartate kinase [Aureivirga sp. CE67]
MNVLKFGGTSVGSYESIQQIKSIVESQNKKTLIVLSAMSGVTNELVKINAKLKSGDSKIDTHIEFIKSKHQSVSRKLFSDKTIIEEVDNYIDSILNNIEKFRDEFLTKEGEAIIITLGETLSTYIFSRYLKANNISNQLLDASFFMMVENDENPNLKIINTLFNREIERIESSDIYITQGFIRIDRNNKISTLDRGGSDYTATILGAALEADEVQIWTDIDGFHNNDPRYVENTQPIEYLTFDEAAELAYFGAKILHPKTVMPIRKKGIPLYLKNTFKPESNGTLIFNKSKYYGLKSISAKDGITAIKVKSNKMLMAYGFLMKIFEVFEKHKTPIDMITTSEVAISLTIDTTTKLDKIVKELKNYGEIEVETNQSIICLVGQSIIEDKGSNKIFELLNEMPVRMISYGGSENNISLLVSEENKVTALQSLHQKLFHNIIKV